MSASDAPAILIEGARKTYPAQLGGTAREAVRDVGFTVNRGEVHGLLGPNGAGKTTTLKMLVGLVRPTAGRFEILGRAASPQARASMGFLPEQPYFPAQLTAFEVLRLHGRLAGLSPAAITARATELLESVGLQGRGSTQLTKFSRGMLQRLGIAQAVLTSPEVVVLDEPASGLDPMGQRDIRNLMLGLKEGGTTVLLSSHQLSEVEAVCDAVTILAHGRVAAEGSIDSLLNVEGQVSVRIRGGDGSLPDELAAEVSDVAFSGGEWMFSVPDGAVRRVVDLVDDVGWKLVSVAPKRETLEDYFARLLISSDQDGAAA